MALLPHPIAYLLVGALAATSVSAPAAWAQYPPTAEPDVGAMAIGVQDLPRGATVISQGAEKFPGADAAYERAFTLMPRAARRAGFDFLESTVAVYDDIPTAASAYGALRRVLGSARGRRALARSIARAIDVPTRRVKVGSVRALRVGDESFAIPVSLHFAGVTIREVLASARVDRAFAQVVTTGSGSPGSLMRRTTAMLDTSVQHIRAGLPAAGTSRRRPRRSA
jgi:hypothetical protein